MPEFNLLGNLPSLIFTLAICVVFVLFIRAGTNLIRAGQDSEKLERARKLLLNTLYGFFIILLIAFVFFLVTHLVKKGEALRPPEVLGEFPSSPSINFPPALQFIEIGKYYFTGPQLLKKNNVIGELAVYAILCKKNVEYDIIYIDQIESRVQLLNHKEYKCWMENCGQKLGNLYVAIFRTPQEKYDLNERKKIKEELENQINPPCSTSK